MLLEFVGSWGDGIDSVALDLRRKNPDLAQMWPSFQGWRPLQEERHQEKCGAITTGHYLKGVD